MNSMAEPTPAATPSKTKPKPTELGAPFEAPKYELPKFELPKMEIPAAFREVAEKSVSQAKETYERMKSAAVSPAFTFSAAVSPYAAVVP